MQKFLETLILILKILFVGFIAVVLYLLAKKLGINFSTFARWLRGFTSGSSKATPEKPSVAEKTSEKKESVKVDEKETQHTASADATLKKIDDLLKEMEK